MRKAECRMTNGKAKGKGERSDDDDGGQREDRRRGTEDRGKMDEGRKDDEKIRR